MQSDISLASLPNNSPPSYTSFSDGDDQETEEGVSEEHTPRASIDSDTAPLVERRND